MKHQEDNMQIAFFKAASIVFPHIPEKLLHHSPNGGKRNATEAARFRQMGVRAGFPDVILLLPGNGFNCLCMEFKTEKGKQTAEQKEFQEQAEAAGNKYVIVRSVEQAIDAIKNYLK
ncbi:VRR-NUC domain protein [Bacteroidales bacterium Barb6XT]|nr:VRR-NUC domain protein [Bacteroidales bacterium Barb6XT]